MTMTIIFHDDTGSASWYVVINDNQVCTKILSVYYFFGKFASSSLHQQKGLCRRINIVDLALVCRVAKLLAFWQNNLSNDGLGVRNLPEIRKCVL